MKIIKISDHAYLTTAHPASSRGIPVLVVDGTAYGPEDDLAGVMAGSAIVCSDYVSSRPLDSLADRDLICRWLSQSAQHGARWIETVKRSMQGGTA
jgi:hypothetical protein